MADESDSVVPVVDLFAGPGGLGEGFASCHRLPDTPTKKRFNVQLSVEKDKYAWQTLLIRSFLRKFDGEYPPEYRDFLRSGGRECLSDVLQAYPDRAEAARSEARHLTLGSEEVHAEVGSRIDDITSDRDAWVLVGGPPCQAYSIAGRSRNQAKEDYRPEDDERHFLYQEFLRVLGETGPPVFLLENVKGLVSATVENQLIFEQMLTDLRRPAKALSDSSDSNDLEYHVVPVIRNGPEQRSLLEEHKDPDLRRFVVKMEKFGIPQTRHRLFLLGVRTNLSVAEAPKLEPGDQQIPIENVLSGLPKLRSGLSRKTDTFDAWARTLDQLRLKHWFPDAVNEKTGSDAVSRLMRLTVQQRDLLPETRGGNYLSEEPDIDFQPDWYLRSNPAYVLNHEARAHMGEDLLRYLYAASYAKVKGESPVLADFPEPLLPNHKSVEKALEDKTSYFSDRFRVQRRGRPATTVTSHISKDGHYYIHPDPTQCRSLTVREAARVQTFPDDYFFAGSRTSQYVQVGNAVPPLLAARIARLVYTILEDADLI